MNKQRDEKISNVLMPHYTQMLMTKYSDTIKFYMVNEEFVINSFWREFSKGLSELAKLQKLKVKSDLKYVNISFLFSAAYGGGNEVKIDFYDNRYYRDIHEIDCFWNYDCVIKNINDDILSLGNMAKKQIARYMDYETNLLSPVYYVGCFKILMDVVKRIVGSNLFKENISSLNLSSFKIFFGSYLDQTKCIADF